jgi:DNA-binding SARP family transcriptional activator
MVLHSALIQSRSDGLRMAELEFYLLGPWRVVHARQGDLEFRGRLPLALLAYLVVESARPHSRESLLGLLWPELPEADARNNLRVTCSRLGKQLGNSRSIPFLSSTRFELAFNPDSSHWLDVAEFQALMAAVEAHAHDKGQVCPDCCDKLARAAELYRGPFLDGFYLDGCPAFEEWQLVQRERLHLQIIETLGRLAGFYEGNGELKRAEGYARRLLELDALREDAYRQLLRVLNAQGRRAEALAEYQACRQVLHEELGVEPDPTTQQLYQRIKAGDT